MKRIILIIGALLLGFAMKAQEAGYTCRYWFDQNHAQAVTTTFGASGWEAELDVGNLSDGVHALHLQVMAEGTESVLGIVNDSLYHATDTAIMKWSAPQSYLFLKLVSTPSAELTYHYWFDQDHATMHSGTVGSGQLLLDVADLEEGLHALHVMLEGTELTASQTYLFLKTDTWENETPNYVYHCWFDEDYQHQQTDSIGEGYFLLDAESLEEGMHSVHVFLEGTTLTATQSYLFMKVAPFATDSVDMSHLAYHCWFDQDFGHRVTDSLGNGQLLLDVANLEDGLHTVHVMLEGSTLTATQSYMFMKMAVENPTAPLQYHCWFDQDYANVQTGLVGGGLVELEVADLPNGIHTVNVQLDNGSLTAPQTYLFYKQPLGGYGVARWEYWLNDDFDNRNTTLLSPTVDSLSIVSLLRVGHPAVRSSCFHFHPNGDSPYINAKNQISFRIWDAEMRFMDMTRFYVDEHVQQGIAANVFERNTTETFAAPRNNQIQWFKLDAVVGDSLSFVASKACTMQLFAPSGEEVFNVSGPESIALRGIHAWEDGTYYLAVHDQMGSGEQLSVTYNWVYRYAILAYDVHLVGNGGCSTITFNGNGYNSLLDVYLVNAQNDTIRRLDIGHESNSTTTVTFNFYGENLGAYDAVFEFYDETIRINGALEVQEPVDIVLTSTVSYPTTFRRDTECTYTFTITNEGNMTAYAVPIYIYIATEPRYGISCIDIEEFDLPSYYDYVKELYEWSDSELRNLKEYSDYIGYDHYFVQSIDKDENSLDSVLIRSGNFYLVIPPYETRTITLSITSSITLETWLSCPNEWLPVIDNYSQTRFANNEIGESRLSSTDFCCWHNDVEDICNNLANTLSTFSTGVGILAAATYGSGLVLALAGIIAPNPATTPILEGCAAILELEAAQLAALAAATGYVSCLSSALGSISAQVANNMCNGDMTFADGAVSWGGTALSCASAVIGHLKPALVGDKLMMAMHATGVAAESYSMAHNKKNPECTDEPPKGGKSTPVQPCEPNEIRGYVAESGSHYMMQEIQTITYEIESENDTTATAAAHTIIVRDTLDINKFDVASLAAYRVTIHDKVLELNGEHNFVYTLDLRPNVYVIAQIQLECDDETGIVVWTITSLDPMTMEPTTDPNQGALPINYNGEGIATFTFNVNLKEPFPDGTEISNRVGIIFDLEEPVITDTWTNTVDAVKPTSHIEEVTPVADSLSFSFVSEDNRSGVWYHSLYYRNDSTQMQWQVKKPQITENSLMLFFDDFQTTEYLVMAVDSAGNREEKDMVAEYIYYYEGPGPASQTDNLAAGWNWWSTYVEMNNTNGLEMLQNGLGHNGLTIKSQNDFTDNYYQDMGEDYWYGSLESLRNEDGYLINVLENGEVTMSGSAAIPMLHPITIQPQWNWIGYPVSVPQTVTTALAGFNPSGDDMLKGQDDFASYYEGYGWYPDDFMLVPGQCYLYLSKASESKTLTYAGGSRGWNASKVRKPSNSYWPTNVHAFADNLNVIAIVSIDSLVQRNEHLELGVFVDGECRGSARLRYFAPLDRYYALLTVSGQEGDRIGFQLVDTDTYECFGNSLTQITFSKNAVWGSFDKPFEVGFGGVFDGQWSLSLYPNPVERNTTFSLSVPQNEEIVEVVITDVLGTVIRHEIGLQNTKSIKGLPTAGVYLVQAVGKSGITYHGRLIVE